ncbi:MAG TPA: tripartite tricarboxylate transporter substrate binding protein [Acidocella sp.]|jgi:tripartite-type tricarboxylate transporter receptor subunit TctC|nr:tripartite tricarboxylate transporter substrate binding protein [Acidocella sp.]OYV24677.1 MAG: MFS transporter [Rhodospirillales bacterium 20-58-10]HQT38878.1 tripartite tricarboxylate transporter substrate binding protein [Acidocella sp.]
MSLKSLLHSAYRSIVALAAFGLMLALPASAFADSYPSRPVTIIVPFAAGGSADVYGRILAQRLTAQTGQSFIVEDRPGAGSIIGSEAAATSAPDGYTLLIISNTHTVNETLFPNKPFKLLSNFVPVAPINTSELVLVTRPTLGIKTIPALLALAKQKPNGLTFASSGPGTPYYMAGELLNQMGGVSILHVPFKGSSEARVDVMGGQVDMMFDATTTMLGLINSGKVTAIATTGSTTSKVLPNLPTVAQTIPGYDAEIWLGVVAPKGTPADIVAKLNADITKVAQDPAVQAEWLKQGATPMIMTPTQFGQYIQTDIVKWAKVIKLAGLKITK